MFTYRPLVFYMKINGCFIKHNSIWGAIDNDYQKWLFNSLHVEHGEAMFPTLDSLPWCIFHY